MPNALITGITGQDGAWLALSLLNKGYTVFGLKRRLSTQNLWRLDYLGITKDIQFVDGDMTDSASLMNAVETSNPDEVYNLAAQSFVKASFDAPQATFDINAKGVINLLEVLRGSKVRIYQASTSEMFGLVNVESQDETTPFHPRSPYGVAKVAAHYACVNYREAYDMNISCGILFNHESTLRGDEFVTKKITNAVREIKVGQQKELRLGNLEPKRDWGHAADYVEAMWLMLQNEPDDYVVATGETHSVREFADKAFKCVGLDYRDYVKRDMKYMRPSDVPLLCGDASKIKKLGWKPKYSFDDLVLEMVCKRIRKVA